MSEKNTNKTQKELLNKSDNKELTQLKESEELIKMNLIILKK